MFSCWGLWCFKNVSSFVNYIISMMTWISCQTVILGNYYITMVSVALDTHGIKKQTCFSVCWNYFSPLSLRGIHYTKSFSITHELSLNILVALLKVLIEMSSKKTMWAAACSGHQKTKVESFQGPIKNRTNRTQNAYNSKFDLFRDIKHLVPHRLHYLDNQSLPWRGYVGCFVQCFFLFLLPLSSLCISAAFVLKWEQLE